MNLIKIFDGPGRVSARDLLETEERLAHQFIDADQILVLDSKQQEVIGTSLHFPWHLPATN